MQAPGFAIEQEANRRLPGLLRELLDEPIAPANLERARHDAGVDMFLSDEKGRRWVVEVKASSRPGRMADAAQQLRRSAGHDAIPLLVVPYMSPAGARAAEDAGVNWLDLSGNAHIRYRDLYVNVQGRPNQFRSPGRPSSPFAPKSARIARALLQDPLHWWRQRQLVDATGLDDGNVSRIVRRLDEEFLLERRDDELRPRDASLLLDAWAQDYRLGRHHIMLGHISGTGSDLAHTVGEGFAALGLHHAFTGLPAAWAMDHFAQFRLVSVYVDGDPHEFAEGLAMRPIQKGANVQLIAPNDQGVFFGEELQGGLNCVAWVQAYLDLLHLPERANEAARHLRAERLDENARAN
jgi:hypothetical protein